MALNLGFDFVPLVGDFVGLFLRGPEAGDAEAVFQVRPEVVHVAYREGEIEAELESVKPVRR